MNEVGEVLWHSLDKHGHIAVYDVEWGNGVIETDVPASLLEGVKQTEHADEGEVNELHEKHGIKGHEKDSDISERKYKKKGKKRKAKKAKKNRYLVYPYFAGDNMFASGGDSFDAGGDAGGE